MIDFTKCKEILCTYSGSEKKKKIIYDGKEYLLKFPDPVREIKNELSYMNNVYSEYIGCKICKTLGIPVQEVIIGIYKEESTITNDKEKVVVACEDFTSDNKKLVEFSDIANSVTNIEKHFTTFIEDVYTVLDNLNYDFNKQEIINRFWDMFILDTLIGNPDRHLSNFGFLQNSHSTFAPIYDCGSSLHALLLDSKMEEYLKNDVEFKNIVLNIYSVYRYNGKKLTYKQFYEQNINDLNYAVLRIVPKINLNDIINIIDNTPYISDVRKEFLKKSIRYRKENILDIAYNKLCKD